MSVDAETTCEYLIGGLWTDFSSQDITVQGTKDIMTLHALITVSDLSVLAVS